MSRSPRPSSSSNRTSLMPMRRLASLAVAALCGAAIASTVLWWQESQPQPSAKQVRDQWRATPMEPTVSGRYLKARYALSQYDDKEASLALHSALSMQPDDPHLIRQAFEAYLLAGEVNQAVALLDKAEKAGNSLKPEIRDLLYLPLVHLVRSVNAMTDMRYDDALTLIDQSLAAHGLTKFHKSFFGVYKAWLEVRTGELAQVKQRLAPVKDIPGFDAFAMFHTALIMQHMGQMDDAERYFERALAESRHKPRRVVELYAHFLLHQGKQEKARALLDEFLAETRDIWVDSATLKAIVSEHTERPMIATINAGIAELFYGGASIVRQQGDVSTAYRLLHLALHLRPDFHDARIMLASLLYQEKRYDEALHYYREIPQTSPLYNRTAMEIARVMGDQGDVDKSIALLRDLAKRLPDSHIPWLHMADLRRQNEAFAEAADAYFESLNRLQTDAAHIWPVYYLRGISYERSEQWDKAEQDFLTALDHSPNNPDVLNYLAYSWLVQEVNIEQAKEMLEKAVKLRPRDAHIVDSMGWAWYKLGEYDKALMFLERAIELQPDDPTINDHLGDVFWKLGREREARFQWQRALLFDPDAKQEAELRTKLRHGLHDGNEAVLTQDGSIAVQ